ncbi:hypothetical protein N0V82_002233 [Gnomoniopsis sp. IMI 355080]|nr:hypothetical protein N0V82_002233 [Gnomoniopsis sp. IMI 355080]
MHALRDQTQKTIIKARLGKPRTKSQRRTSVETGDTKSPPTPASAQTPPTPRQKVGKARSLSLPEAGGGDCWSTNGVDYAGKRRKKSAATAQQESCSFEWQVEEDALVDPLLWQTIDTPIVDQARCYFLSNYVVYSPRSPEGGMLTFIPSLLATNEAAKEHFEDLFSAVSIAAFSMRPNASHAAPSGRTYYGRGVESLRKSLGDKILARSDATLASTILLGFYEVESFLICASDRTPGVSDETQGIVNEGVGLVSYNPHFKGAITLLRMREGEQFSTSHGTEMFNFVMQVLMRQYVLSLTCSEDDVCRWSNQAGLRLKKHQRPHLAAMYVGHLRQKAARLLDTDERNAKSTQEAMEILGTAQKFEKMVTQSFEAEATELLGERVEASPDANGISDFKLVYSDWWTASRSLNKFAFRLLLCHIIADTTDWLCDGPDAPQFQGSGMKAAAIAKRDIDSIIASIPYLCAWKGSQQNRGASSPCGRDDATSTQGITSMLVIWPLYLAGKSRFATVEQKEYIRQKLAWMAENMGVRHALGVSKYLKLLEANLRLSCFLFFNPLTPSEVSSRQAAAACFVVGKETLPAEVADSVTAIQSSVTCGSGTTIDNVPDVTSGAVSFSDVDFSKSSDTPLQFALNTFNTSSPLADTDLQTVQDQLNVYLATEAGLRSVGGSLAIKVPKFFLAMQVSRIQTAQGNPPTDAGQQVDHLRDKVTKNAAGESQDLLDQVTQLATVLS